MFRPRDVIVVQERCGEAVIPGCPHRLSVYEGTNQIQRLVTARNILR